jgi:hypothetical protein
VFFVFCEFVVLYSGANYDDGAPSGEPLTACLATEVKTLTQINASNKSLYNLPIKVSLLRVASYGLAVESQPFSRPA